MERDKLDKIKRSLLLGEVLLQDEAPTYYRQPTQMTDIDSTSNGLWPYGLVPSGNQNQADEKVFAPAIYETWGGDPQQFHNDMLDGIIRASDHPQKTVPAVRDPNPPMDIRRELKPKKKVT